LWRRTCSNETIVKANREKYYNYTTIDVERNELIPMRVYPSRNYLTTKLLISKVYRVTFFQILNKIKRATIQPYIFIFHLQQSVTEK